MGRFAPALVCIAAIVAGLLWWPRAQTVWDRGAALGPIGWSFGAIGMTTSYLLRSGRLRAEWSTHPAAQPLACLRITLLHNAAVNLLPMRAGELGYPWLLHRYWGVGWADSAGSLVWMRVQDAIVLAWLAALSLAAAQWQAGSWPLMVGASVAGGATCGMLVMAGVWHRNRFATWFWSAGNWLVKLGTSATLLALLGGTPPIASWCGTLAGEAAAVLPVQAPAGFGSYEAAVVLGARMVTPLISVPELLAAALVLHLFAIAVALAAAGVASLLIAAVPQAAPT